MPSSVLGAVDTLVTNTKSWNSYNMKCDVSVRAIILGNVPE